MDEFKDATVSMIKNGFLVSIYFPKKLKNKSKCMEPVAVTRRVTVFCKTLKQVKKQLAKIYE